MNTKKVSIVIPYTVDKKILLQDRHSIKKWGEEWGFWGGKIEEGETDIQAAHREIKEELNFIMNNITYIGETKELLKKYAPPHKEWLLHYKIFITKVKEELSQFKVNEGDGLKFFTIKEARKLTLAPVIDYKTLDILEKYFKNI